MEWFNVKDLEELKQLGSFNEVRAQIKAEGFNNLHVSGRSWGGLLKSIEDFRKKIGEIQRLPVNETAVSSNKETQPADLSEYFNSQASEYIFYLTELDGESRLKKLGVSATHFSSKKAAKTWHNQISKVIHPDVCSHQKAAIAMAKLNDLYQQMVGRE